MRISDWSSDVCSSDLTAQPGRASNSVGSHRSAFQETDFHELEQARFAALTAELLKKRALKKEYEKLIVVAPPRTLGELRKHYHKEVEERLVGDISKDLTEIGRASCRERVCTYVNITVVADQFKNKTKIAHIHDIE